MAELQRMDNSVVIDRFPIRKPDFVIWRAEEADVCVDDDVVSARHCLIETLDDPERPGKQRFYIRDLDSTNETFVNDSPVKHQQLRSNDVIRIGWIHLKFIDENEPSHEKTKKIHKSWIPGIFYTK